MHTEVLGFGGCFPQQALCVRPPKGGMTESAIGRNRAAPQFEFVPPLVASVACGRKGRQLRRGIREYRRETSPRGAKIRGLALI